MRWLVDGYNVIRRDPDLQAREAESLEAGRRALLHLIARARPRAAGRVHGRVRRSATLRRRTDGRPHPCRLLAPTPDGRRRDHEARAPAAKRRRRRQLRPEDPGRGPPGRKRRSDRRAISGSAGGSGKVIGHPAIKDDSDGEPAREKRGNPRRLSKKAQEGPTGPRTAPPTLTLARVSWRIAVWRS